MPFSFIFPYSLYGLTPVTCTPHRPAARNRRRAAPEVEPVTVTFCAPEKLPPEGLSAAVATFIV
jgi:hypothetical protein